MKKVFFLLFASIISVLAIAQSNPVSWKFSSKKISDKVYEIHMQAIMQPGWHIYAQLQPKDAIALPTVFSFTKNPLINFDGKVKEVGKLEKYHDASLDVSANQYANAVDFVQRITLKVKAKTTFSGNVEYQTCDDKKCLPPKKVPFSLSLI